MPEGPEVETIRRGLELGLVGQKVAGVEVIFGGSMPAPAAEIEKWVVGANVERLERRAKTLIVRLSGGYSLLIHLRMTGQLVLVKADGERFAGGHPTNSMAARLPDKSTRAVFRFASGDLLYFNDQRKFGRIKLVPEEDVEKDSLLGRLGPEVLSDGFNEGYLAGQLARHKGAPVKAVLLDQSVAGGMGNIYVDESLHLAKIHPARKAGSLKPSEVKRLVAAARETMELGIEYGGTTFSKYVNALGGQGDYMAHARVFGRQGEACPVCGSVIQKIRVAGRGTHICPKCQKLI